MDPKTESKSYSCMCLTCQFSKYIKFHCKLLWFFFFSKYLESDVKENLPDYKKEIHRSTELKLSALTSKKFEKKLNPLMQSISPLASSLPENDYTSEVHLLSTSTSDDHPSGTTVVESWEEVEEVIHKRWKHKHWLSLPGESHLPEQ